MNHRRVRAADMARQTSGAPSSVEVEGHVKRAAEREVPPSRSWAQAAGSARRPSGASPETGVRGGYTSDTSRKTGGMSSEGPTAS